MPSRKLTQSVQGVVVTDKMSKTRVIEIQRYHQHRLYKKKQTGQIRLFIHDEKNTSKIGDNVIAVSTRPLSGNKHFRLVRVVGEGKRT